MLELCPNLEYLDLTQTAISDSAFERLDKCCFVKRKKQFSFLRGEKHSNTS